MALEIEKKFLLNTEAWRPPVPGKEYCQGYLSTDKNRTVRVRTIDNQGFLTVKGASIGCVREEFEYEIPFGEAREMLTSLCHQPLIRKIRTTLPIDDLIWEIDEFLDHNQGLILAEVELTHEHQSITLPGWIGPEVTGDPRYYNSNLVIHPYNTW